MNEDRELTYKIRGIIYKLYNALGPGLLETVYEEALSHDLTKMGYKVERQLEVPIIYDGELLKTPLRLDMLINERIIIELKSVKDLLDVHRKQLLTYLRLKHLHTGILVNFTTDDIVRSTETIYNTKD